MAMNGERVPATRVFGGTNSPHRGRWIGGKSKRFFTGGCHVGFGVLGPRRERGNATQKAVANTQRRRLDRVAICLSLAD